MANKITYTEYTTIPIDYGFEKEKYIIGIEDQVTNTLVAAKTIVPIKAVKPNSILEITPLVSSAFHYKYVEGDAQPRFDIVNSKILFDLKIIIDEKPVSLKEKDIKNIISLDWSDKYSIEKSDLSTTIFKLVLANDYQSFIEGSEEYNKIKNDGTFSETINLRVDYDGWFFETNLKITYENTFFETVSLYDSIEIAERDINNTGIVKNLISIDGYYNDNKLNNDELLVSLNKRENSFTTIASTLGYMDIKKENNDWYLTYNRTSGNTISSYYVDDSQSALRTKNNILISGGSLYINDKDKLADINRYAKNIDENGCVTDEKNDIILSGGTLVCGNGFTITTGNTLYYNGNPIVENNSIGTQSGEIKLNLTDNNQTLKFNNNTTIISSGMVNTINSNVIYDIAKNELLYGSDTIYSANTNTVVTKGNTKYNVSDNSFTTNDGKTLKNKDSFPISGSNIYTINNNTFKRNDEVIIAQDGIITGDVLRFNIKNGEIHTVNGNNFIAKNNGDNITLATSYTNNVKGYYVDSLNSNAIKYPNGRAIIRNGNFYHTNDSMVVDLTTDTSNPFFRIKIDNYNEFTLFKSGSTIAIKYGETTGYISKGENDYYYLNNIVKEESLTISPIGGNGNYTPTSFNKSYNLYLTSFGVNKFGSSFGSCETTMVTIYNQLVEVITSITIYNNYGKNILYGDVINGKNIFNYKIGDYYFNYNYNNSTYTFTYNNTTNTIYSSSDSTIFLDDNFKIKNNILYYKNTNETIDFKSKKIIINDKFTIEDNSIKYTDSILQKDFILSKNNKVFIVKDNTGTLYYYDLTIGNNNIYDSNGNLILEGDIIHTDFDGVYLEGDVLKSNEEKLLDFKNNAVTINANLVYRYIDKKVTDNNNTPLVDVEDNNKLSIINANTNLYELTQDSSGNIILTSDNVNIFISSSSSTGTTKNFSFINKDNFLIINSDKFTIKNDINNKIFEYNANGKYKINRQINNGIITAETYNHIYTISNTDIKENNVVLYNKNSGITKTKYYTEKDTGKIMFGGKTVTYVIDDNGKYYNLYTGKEVLLSEISSDDDEPIIYSGKYKLPTAVILDNFNNIKFTPNESYSRFGVTLRDKNNKVINNEKTNTNASRSSATTPAKTAYGLGNVYSTNAVTVTKDGFYLHDDNGRKVFCHEIDKNGNVKEYYNIEGGFTMHTKDNMLCSGTIDTGFNEIDYKNTDFNIITEGADETLYYKGKIVAKIETNPNNGTIKAKEVYYNGEKITNNTTFIDNNGETCVITGITNTIKNNENTVTLGCQYSTTSTTSNDKVSIPLTITCVTNGDPSNGGNCSWSGSIGDGSEIITPPSFEPNLPDIDFGWNDKQITDGNKLKIRHDLILNRWLNRIDCVVIGENVVEIDEDENSEGKNDFEIGDRDDIYYDAHYISAITADIPDLISYLAMTSYKKDINLKLELKATYNEYTDNKDYTIIEGGFNRSLYNIKTESTFITTDMINNDRELIVYVVNKNGNIVPFGNYIKNGYKLKYYIDGSKDITEVQTDICTLKLSETKIFKEIRFKLECYGKVVSEEIIEVLGENPTYNSSTEIVDVTTSSQIVKCSTNIPKGEVVETWYCNGVKLDSGVNTVEIKQGDTEKKIIEGYYGGNKVAEKIVFPTTKGRLIYPAGEWCENITYTSDDQKTPFVLFDNQYYVLIGKESFGIIPTNSTLWTKMEQYEAVYTKLLVAENGLIGGSVFNGDLVFSQTGINQSGYTSNEYSTFNSEVIEDIFNSGKTENGEFTPNCLFDYEKGRAWFGAGETIIDEYGTVFSKRLVNEYDAFYLPNNNYSINNIIGSASTNNTISFSGSTGVLTNRVNYINSGGINNWTTYAASAATKVITDLYSFVIDQRTSSVTGSTVYIKPIFCDEAIKISGKWYRGEIVVCLNEHLYANNNGNKVYLDLSHYNDMMGNKLTSKQLTTNNSQIQFLFMWDGNYYIENGVEKYKTGHFILLNL